MIRLTVVTKRDPGARPLFNNECLVNYDNKKRISADFLLVHSLGANSGIFSRIKADAKSQKRVLGIWWGNSIPNLQLDVVGTYTPLSGSPVTINYTSGRVPNTSDVAHDVEFGANSLVGYMAVGVLGRCDDQEDRECVTRYN